MLIGNIPFQSGMEIGIYEEGSVLNILYNGVEKGVVSPLIFLGIGAMTDFSALLANPKLMIIGACAQFGIFGAYMLCPALRLRPSVGRLRGYHRRRRRSYRNLHHIKTESGTARSSGRVGLLLHGSDTPYPASSDETVHDSE